MAGITPAILPRRKLPSNAPMINGRFNSGLIEDPTKAFIPMIPKYPISFPPIIPKKPPISPNNPASVKN